MEIQDTLQIVFNRYGLTVRVTYQGCLDNSHCRRLTFLMTAILRPQPALTIYLSTQSRADL